MAVPAPGPRLTFGQRQRRLLAPGIAQGEHGSVAVEERPGLVQQRLPQPPHVALLSGWGRVHRQVGPCCHWLPAMLLQPLQPPNSQLACLGHLRGHGRAAAAEDMG